ncbi:MAG: hypothetical protein ACT4P4_27805 [Betaproteobacteria bacterium]
MKALLERVDQRCTVSVLLLSFWALFWALNGADEFFNGTTEPNVAVTSGVALDSEGAPAFRIHPLQPVGWYGVSNAARFVAWFGQLGLPASAALATLYALSVAQLVVAAIFFYLAARATRREPPAASRRLHQGAFVASAALFVVLCVLDILFGERAELWQHGTYLVLVLLSYELWLSADRYFIARSLLDPAG